MHIGEEDLEEAVAVGARELGAQQSAVSEIDQTGFTGRLCSEERDGGSCDG